jgi:hypothetical protein
MWDWVVQTVRGFGAIILPLTFIYLYTSISEIAFASCNLTARFLLRYGACSLGCSGAEPSICSPCVCSSGQTYSIFAVRPVMRLSCPEFPNLCRRTLCLFTMQFQISMHRLFQITSSDVNYTYAYVRFRILTSSNVLFSSYHDLFLDWHKRNKCFHSYALLICFVCLHMDLHNNLSKEQHIFIVITPSWVA